MTVAPIEILGWDGANRYWAARRSGEPSFVGVQNLGDAIDACTERGTYIVISDEVYDEMLSSGDAWLPRPSRVQSASV